MLRIRPLFAIILLGMAGPARAQVWDVSRDFSTTKNPSGPWAFGSTTDRTGTIDLYTDTSLVPQAYATNQLAGWSSPALGVAPYVAKNISSSNWNYDGTSGGGGPAVLRPGEVLLIQKQQPDRFTVARWTAPRNGIFRITATFTRFENKQGYNSNYFVVKNGTDLPGGSGLLTGFGNADSTATYTSSELALQAGDTISFVVGFGTDGSDDADGNTLSATIRSTDGFGDLILQNQTDRTIALLGLDGAAVVSSASTQPTLPVNWRVAAAGDFNGDGRRDLVVQNTQTRAVSLLFMNGNLVQSSVPVNPTLPANWQVRAAGDFNNDGKTDLAVQNTTTGQLALLTMDGAKIVGSASLTGNLPTDWFIMGAGEFNGDGKLDLVVQNGSTRQVSVLALEGTRITGSVSLFPTLPAGWLVGAVGDYDGDGKADLVVQNGATGQISILSVVNLKITASTSVRPTPPAGWVLVGPR